MHPPMGMSDSTESFPTPRSSEDDPTATNRPSRPTSPQSLRVRRAPARGPASPESTPVTPTDASHLTHAHGPTAEPPLHLDARPRLADLDIPPHRDEYFAQYPCPVHEKEWRLSPTPRSPASVHSPLPPPPRRPVHNASTSIADYQSLKSVITTTSDPARPTDANSIRRPSDTLSLQSSTQHQYPARRSDHRCIFPDPHHHWSDGSDTDDNDSIRGKAASASPDLGFSALRGNNVSDYTPRSASRYVSQSSTHTVVPRLPQSSARSTSSHPLLLEPSPPPSPINLSITMRDATASTWSIGTFGTATVTPRDEASIPVSIRGLSPSPVIGGQGGHGDGKSVKESVSIKRSNRVRPAPIRANAAVYARLARTRRDSGAGIENIPVPHGKELGLDKNLQDGEDAPSSSWSGLASSPENARGRPTTLLAKAMSNKGARVRFATPLSTHEEGVEPPDPELRELLRLQRKALETSEPKVVRLFKNALLKPFDPRD